MTIAAHSESKSTGRFTKSEIASLTPSDIAKLTYDEMVEVVIASEIPIGQIHEIHEVDGETLVRLVYSARGNCRRR